MSIPREDVLKIAGSVNDSIKLSYHIIDMLHKNNVQPVVGATAAKIVCNLLLDALVKDGYYDWNEIHMASSSDKDKRAALSDSVDDVSDMALDILRAKLAELSDLSDLR